MQSIGDPIDCDFGIQSSYQIDNFCFIRSTFYKGREGNIPFISGWVSFFFSVALFFFFFFSLEEMERGPSERFLGGIVGFL